jgi:hypothetical protein
VRRLLSPHAPSADHGEELLTIVRRFDEMLVERTDLHHLVVTAAQLLGAPVFALDILGVHFVAVNPDGSPAPGEPETGHALLREADPERTKPGEVMHCEINDQQLGAAILEHGQGRLGVVWTTKDATELAGADELVLERFAQAASIVIQQDQPRAEPGIAADPSALEMLIEGGLDERGLAHAVRATNLDVKLAYAVVAMAVEPADASPALAVAAIARALDGSRVAWRSVTVFNVSLIVVSGAPVDSEVFDGAIADADRGGWQLSVGVGDAVGLRELHRSATQARQALAFGETRSAGSVTYFQSLGALHLLARIPRADVDADDDVAAMARLERARSGVDELALLVAYCETASLRQTGERMFLHHSSVEYRLRHIEQALGFSVADPTGRFRALLAATMHRVARASESAL